MSSALPQTSSGQSDKPAASGSGRWLHGPILDIGIGCGGLYMWIFLLYAIDAKALHALQPSYLVALLMLLISMPHYGGTLVRVYEQRSERKKYFLFSIVFSVLILGIFVVGLQNAVIGSWFFTVYLTWSPWHYTGQNYGLAVMFLRRRGIAFDETTKRLLYWSFILSFALTFLLWHTAANSAPRGESAGTISFIPLGIPTALNDFLLPVTAFAYLATLGAAAQRLLRTASIADLVPVACLAATQALWFGVPYFVAGMQTSTGIAPIDEYFTLRIFTIWTIMAHASQYLWVTSYYAKATPGWRGPIHYYWKAAATGVAIWTIPAILFSSDTVGTYSYGGGLSLMIAAGVNLHHFVLDGAIWKLRNSKIASVLIRTVPEESAIRLDEDARANPFARRVVWGLAFTAMLSAYFVFWQESFSLKNAYVEGAYTRYEAGLDRLGWLGRDSSRRRVRLGHAYWQAGEYEDSKRQYRRSLDLHTNMDAFNGLMSLFWHLEDFDAVIETCEDAFGEYPNEPGILVTESLAWIKLDNLAEARRVLERALVIAPESQSVREGLLHLDQLERSKAGNASSGLSGAGLGEPT